MKTIILKMLNSVAFNLFLSLKGGGEGGKDLI